MKQYEVRRHPMDGDFLRGTALYLVTFRCALQAGQRLSGVNREQSQAILVNLFNSLPLS